jgi:hypothetical protein
MLRIAAVLVLFTLPTFAYAENLTEADILGASILTKEQLQDKDAYIELGSALCPAEILDTQNQQSAFVTVKTMQIEFGWDRDQSPGEDFYRVYQSMTRNLQLVVKIPWEAQYDGADTCTLHVIATK